MSYCCSQCGFTSNFESALIMHRQLHHGDPVRDIFEPHELKKSHTLPGMSSSFLDTKQPDKELKLPMRISSATRLFGRLRARISRANTLFSHPEDAVGDNHDLCMLSECTSKAFKDELPLITTRSEVAGKTPPKETFGCHLCNFEADRITVLDRHLLDDHKIGIDNLLQLVMAKTKDGLSEDTHTESFRRRQPYYKPHDHLEEGEFIVETVQPKIRILRHAATNTENSGLNDNFKMITSEFEKIVNIGPTKSCDENELLMKMQTMKECMCKFEDSYTVLKKMLTKECDTKSRSDRAEPAFDLRLRDSPRDW